MSDQQVSESELIEGLLCGSEEHIELLVRRFQDKVLRTAFLYTRSWHDSEEIAQEVFVKICRRIGMFGGQSKFSTWMYRITVNECIDFLRKKKRRPWLKQHQQKDDEETRDHLEQIPSTLSTRQGAENKEIRSAIDKAVETLPEKQRMIFSLFYLEQLKIEEIAEVLKVSEGNIKAQLWQAREKLKFELTPLFGATLRG